MESNEQVVQILKGLLAACRVSEMGYLTAAGAISGINTREVLRSYADQRRKFTEELQTEIRFHSGRFFEVDPPIDSLRNFQQAIATRNKKEILLECERAEEAMIRVYEDSLSRKLPWDVYLALTHQYSDIKEAHHFLDALEQITGNLQHQLAS